MTDDRLLAAKKKFSRLLKEIFQFDSADLDFGIYRILAMRRGELEKFLDDDLLPQVENTLASAAGDRASVESELAKLEEQLRGMGVADFAKVPKWNELKGKLESSPDLAALAREVFSDLTTFFARYYDEGDFMALARYKGDTYAIPYDGSEVKLYWANADQHYIKTTEQHANYTAVVEGVSDHDKLRLRFRLAAAEFDQDNNKSTEKRRYVLRATEPVETGDAELTVWFEYRVPEPGNGRQPTQTAMCDEAEKAILAALPPERRAALSRKAPQNPDKYTVLGYQLYRYTKKNTSDYFIHEDLGKFLGRELDFFLKNEVLFLDDLEGRKTSDVDVALTKVRAIRAVGRKIIVWLAQIEGFQKRLFTKKKFVLATSWLITLDHLPESLLPTIAANHAQQEDWVNLFAVDRVEGDLVSAPYTQPPTAEFLRQYPGLTVDTRFYDRETIRSIVEGLGDNLGAPDGLLIKGENYAALRLIERRYDRCVDAVYLDPPYKTGGDGFLYKDGYQVSTWICMMAGRLVASLPLLSERAAVFVSIDDNSYCELNTLGTYVFGEHKYRTTFVWQKKDTPANDSQGVSTTHEYVLMFPFGQDFRRGLIPRSQEQISLYKNQDNDPRGPWTRTSLVVKRFVKGNDFDLPTPQGESVRPPAGQGWSMSRERLQELIDDNRIWWGTEASGMPYRKTFLSEVNDGVVPVSWWDYGFAGSNRNAQGELRARFAGPPPFDTPKPLQLLKRILEVARPELVLDYFAGSGTTSEAAIERSRSGAACRHISIEVGDHFFSALVPRVRKAIFSNAWKDGVPARGSAVSHVVKCIQLESYDDTLENITLTSPTEESPLFGGTAALREDYTLRYMLNLEAEGSLLRLDHFRKPWNYTIKVRRDGVVQDSPVDLVETFNYLIGLRVKRCDTYGQDGLLFVLGAVPDGHRVIVVWRDCDLWPNDKLEEKCRQAFESFRPSEFDLVYVNGDNHLPIIKTGEESWKVNLIEETFHARMFDTSDVE